MDKHSHEHNVHSTKEKVLKLSYFLTANHKNNYCYNYEQMHFDKKLNFLQNSNLFHLRNRVHKGLHSERVFDPDRHSRCMNCTNLEHNHL